jgi:cytochrome b6
MKENLTKKIYNWFDDRIHFDDIIKFAAKKYVPVHSHSIWYYFGGVTLFLFIIQVFSGILLLLYYKGSEDLAFESIQFIMTKVEFGWLIRSVHSWSANLMVLAAFIHMFSVYFTKAYRKPREITWVTGMLMFFLALGFGFSGYLLPWNELALFATKVGTDIAGVIRKTDA